MKREVISTIVAEGHTKGQNSGPLVGTVLVVDIVGFTRLTRNLMRKGRRGADAISKIIRSSIAPSIDSVESCGGVVTGFAGDAFTVFFDQTPEDPTDIVANRIQKALSLIVSHFSQSLNETPKENEANLGIKIGIAFGEITWRIVGPPKQKSSFFSGEALAKANIACANCGNNQIGIDQSANHRVIEINRDSLFEKKGDVMLVDAHAFPSISDSTAQPPPSQKNSTAILDQQGEFVPKEVINMDHEGELRDIVACMLSVDSSFQTDDQFCSIIEFAIESGGFFDKIDFSEKGCLILVLFGAPIARDRMPARAASFVSSVISRHGDCVRSGMALGTAFTGFVGSDYRCEYTALGDVVNLAARLVMKANWGESLADTAIAKMLPGLVFRKTDDLELKGFSAPQEVYQLSTDSLIELPASQSRAEFAGRTREIQALEEALNSLSKEGSAKVIHVAGPAGMGKSALISEVRKRDKTAHPNYRWHRLSCDEIIQKGFYPFKKCLRNIFFQNDQRDALKNAEEFARHLDSITEQLDDSNLNESLQAARPFLLALLDLSSNDEILNRLDNRARYENTQSAIVTVFKAIASIQPLVLLIEDIQWSDQDSLALLQILARGVREFPLLIIATCRAANEDAVSMIELDQDQDLNLIWLNPMSDEESAELLRAVMKSFQSDPTNLSPEALAFIRERGGRNPFYMEQILLYLQENELLDSLSSAEGIENRDIIPPGINMLLTARLDRLSVSLRSSVRAAAVIGLEFSRDILMYMLAIQKVDRQLQSGESEGLWRKLTQIQYLFSHALIRDAAYHMQLEDQLRQSHLVAAESYEALYAERLDPFFPELANHYERAGSLEKAMNYLRRAGELALSHFQNSSASDLFQRWLNLADQLGVDASPSHPDYHRIDALDHLGQALKQAGEWTRAQHCFSQAVDLANKLCDSHRRLHSLVNLGDILRFRGEYKEAMQMRMEALALAEDLDDNDAKATIYGNIGNIHLCQGRLDEALECYQKQESIANSTENLREISLAIGNSGIIHSRRGDLDAAFSCYERQYALSESLQDLPGMASAVGNMGLVFRKRRKLADAEEKFQQQLTLARDSGDKQLINNAIGNLGVISMERGDGVEAEKLFRKQQSFAEELGDRRSIAYTAGMLGKLAEARGDFSEATRFFLTKLSLSEALGLSSATLASLKALASLSMQKGDHEAASEWRRLIKKNEE